MTGDQHFEEHLRRTRDLPPDPRAGRKRAVTAIGWNSICCVLARYRFHRARRLEQKLLLRAQEIRRGARRRHAGDDQVVLRKIDPGEIVGPRSNTFAPSASIAAGT